MFFVLGSWFAELMKVKQEYVIITMCALFAAVMVFFEIRVLGFQFIAYYLLFYSLGFYLNKYQDKVHFLNNRWATLVIWFALAWNWKMHEVPSFIQNLPLPASISQYAYRFITAAIAIYLLFSVSPLLLGSDNRWETPLKNLGYYSLGIYTSHLIFIGDLVEFLLKVSENTTIVVLISFISNLFLSWLIVWLLSKWKVTATLLLGKI